ncbi:MAG: hypothetical protein ACR2RL_06610 [Gammaproteobacteria bacterium]
MTTPLYDHLLGAVFVKFLQGDVGLIERIGAFPGNVTCDSDALLFELPSLFEFLCLDYERASGICVASDGPAYLRFRKSVYEQPTNARLRERGGEVTIARAHVEHDRRFYKLVRCASEDR